MSAGRRQRGDIMLVTLVFLLVLLLGLLVSMRDGIVTTTMTGNNLVRQKDVQLGDVGLGVLLSTIQTTSAGQTLELTASTQPWWRSVAAGTAPPSGSYWDNCASETTSSATSCGVITLPPGPDGLALPYVAYGVVQPTSAGDSTTCPFTQYNLAVYYVLYVHVKEVNGSTAANSETIYRLCVSST
jgi:hypothetical protein